MVFRSRYNLSARREVSIACCLTPHFWKIFLELIARRRSMLYQPKRPEPRPHVSPELTHRSTAANPTCVYRKTLIASMRRRNRLSRRNDRQLRLVQGILASPRKFRHVGTAFDIGIRAGVELPVCSPRILRDRPVETAHDLRRHVLLHSTTTRSAWPRWFSAAGVSGLAPIRHLELDHVYLQLVMRGKSAKPLL